MPVFTCVPVPSGKNGLFLRIRSPFPSNVSNASVIYTGPATRISMNFQELISPEKILLLDSPPGDKLDLMRTLLSRCLNGTEAAAQENAIWESLMEREKSMSTGIGMGVAIPHCSTEHVTEVQGTLALLRQGIDFESADGKEVRIVALLLMPRNQVDQHIKTMAAVAKLLHNDDFRRRVLEAATAEDAHKLLASS